MGNRIREVRETLKDENGKKMSQTKFAEEMLVTRDIIATYEADKVAPTPLFIRTLCEKYNVNEEWLRTGEGEMFNPVDRETEIAEAVAKIYGKHDAFIDELVKILSESTEEQLEVYKAVAIKLAEASKKNPPE